jgi:hypothetical protein
MKLQQDGIADMQEFLLFTVGYQDLVADKPQSA